MDKTKHNTILLPKREGFALLITLSVLSVIMSLTMILLSYFNEVKEDADTTAALIQADVYYADILEQFNKFKNKKSLFNQLYVAPISLHTPDGRFFVSLKCDSMDTGININWLGLENDTTKQVLFQEAQRLFDTLAQQINLEDPDRLLEMILIEIGGGHRFVDREQSRLRQKNGIISYKQFAEIISRYQLEVDDLKVGRIPWGKYFSFSGKAQKIDIDYSTPELISFIFDIDLLSVREWYNALEKPSLASFVNENGGEYNEKKNLFADGTFLGESICSVHFGDGYKFTFEYIQGEAKHFEFYGKH